MGCGGEAIGDNHLRGRIGQSIIYSIQAQNPRHRRDIQLTILISHANRHIQARRNGVYRPRPPKRQFNCVDLAGAHAAYVKHASPIRIATQSHLAGIRNSIGQYLDVETGRKAQRVKLQIGRQTQACFQPDQQQAGGQKSAFVSLHGGGSQ